MTETMGSLIERWNEEAIPERIPVYKLPTTDEDTVGYPPAYTTEEAQEWRTIIQIRPILASLTDKRHFQYGQIVLEARTETADKMTTVLKFQAIPY